MPIVTEADIAAFVNPIFEDALFVARDNNLMLPLVKKFDDRTGVAVRQNSQYGTATMNAIGETDDLVSQAFTPSSIATLTPSEFGAQFFVTDLREESDPFQVRADAAMELGMAAAQSVESNLVSQFSSLTGGTVGAAGTVMAMGHFFAMLTLLRNQFAPGPYAFVCHPFQWHALAKAVLPPGTVTNAPNFQDELLRKFWVGTIGPVDIFTSSNISIDSSDDAYCAMFSPTAIGFDTRRALRIAPQRDESRRGLELNASMVYAKGVWRPKFGVKGLFDAAVPTS